MAHVLHRTWRNYLVIGSNLNNRDIHNRMPSDLKLSVDDQRMQISRNELNHTLDGDTLGIIISYAEYTESEKVLLALQKNTYREDFSGYTIYRLYNTGPMSSADSNDYERALSECSMWICNDGACHEDQQLWYVKPPLFTLGFGGFAYTYAKFPITLNDILPNPDRCIMAFTIPKDFLKIYDICMPMYLASIQSEIDAI